MAFTTENTPMCNSVNSRQFVGVYMRTAEEDESGDVTTEESVLVTERGTDKAAVMELLQRLSDSEPPPSQQLRMLYAVY